MVSNFFAGASYVLKGFGLIRRTGLRRYFVVPISLNVLLFTLLTWYGVDRFVSYTESMLPEGGGWWIGALAVVAVVLVGMAMLVVMFFVFTLLLNLISAPFNGVLSEKVEAVLNHEPLVAKGGLQRFLANFVASIKGELKKYLYFGVLGLVLLLVSLIPGVNILLAPVLAVLFGGWMMALEYLAYPMANHDLHFPQVRKWARSNIMLVFGFGVTVLLLTVTPLINLFIMPAAVAGATMMWLERREFFGTSGVA